MSVNQCTYRCFPLGQPFVNFDNAVDAYRYYSTHSFCAVYRVYSDGTMSRWL